MGLPNRPVIWIADEIASTPSKVVFAQIREPNPIPVPFNTDCISEHQMLSDNIGPGDVVVQDFGWDGLGQLQFRWKALDPTSNAGLLALYKRWIDGARPMVQVHIGPLTTGPSTWLCKFKRFYSPRAGGRLERYKTEIDFRIVEVVT